MKLALYLGAADAAGVSLTTLNIGKMLHQSVDLDLICDFPIKDSHDNLKTYFNVHEGNGNQSRKSEYDLLKKYLQSNDPDKLVQMTLPPIHGSMVVYLGEKYSVPTVYRYSGDRFYAWKVGQGIQIPKWFIVNNIINQYPVRKADQHIVMGPDGRHQLESRGVSESQIFELPPAFDRDRVTEPDVEDTQSNNIGLFVGRKTRLKGVSTLESVLPDVLNEREDIEFWFIGSDDLPRKLANHKNIRDIGYVSIEEIGRYYQAADFFVNPSLTEALSRVLVEAQLCGCRTIAREVGDIPYVTENTFQTESELKEMILNYESLPKESGEQFTIDSLQNKYISSLIDNS